jgi:aspartate kinase
MSGVTDALLAATVAAGEGRIDEAIASLEETFHRHHQTAADLLTPAAAQAFAKQVDNAAHQISELLQASDNDLTRRRRTQDAVLAFGEMLSSELLAELLNERRTNAQHVDARRCILTNDEYTCALPLMPDTLFIAHDLLVSVIEKGFVPVLGGFIASTAEGATTTLGRGGSDYTAALIGAALPADEIQIWTDVTGVLTADPRVEPAAQTVERLSYAEASELAYFGAKVLHPKTIQPAIEGRIPVRICNSRAPEQIGTLVGPETETTQRTIKAIAHKSGVTTVQITSARMLGAYGFLRALFEVFERHKTVVDVVATSEVSVSLSLDDASALPAIVTQLEQLGTVRVEKGCAIVCVVGEGLRGTPGIAARVFSAISDINVTLISQGASSINFTFAIEEEHVEEAVRRLHREFFEPQEGTKQ